MRWTLALAFLLAAVPAAAIAPPTMERYRSELHVRSDGSLDVHETASIITTATTTELTRQVPVGARLDSATKDGRPLDAQERPASAGLSFWTLQGPDVTAGTSEYALSYEVRDAIRRDGDRMMMTWTIGSGWNAELPTVSAVVILPEGTLGAEAACLVEGSASETACTIIETPDMLGIAGKAAGTPLVVRVSWTAPPRSGATSMLVAIAIPILAIVAVAGAGAWYGRRRTDVVS